MWSAPKGQQGAETSSGRRPGSRCNTPSAALREPRQAGETEPMTRRAGRGPTQACSLRSSSRKKPAHFPPAGPFLGGPARPGQVGPWGLGAGRAGLSSTKNPHLVLGGGKRNPRPVFQWPRHGGSPADRGLQVLSGGPDLRCFPTPSAPPPTPGVRCRGPSMLSLNPCLPAGWQGWGPRGTGSAVWDPQKARGF